MGRLNDHLINWALVAAIIFGPTTLAALILGPHGLS